MHFPLHEDLQYISCSELSDGLPAPKDRGRQRIFPIHWATTEVWKKNIKYDIPLEENTYTYQDWTEIIMNCRVVVSCELIKYFQKLYSSYFIYIFIDNITQIIIFLG